MRCTSGWLTMPSPCAARRPRAPDLEMARVLRAAAESGADAVDPGYGLLADSAEFAQAVLDAGLTWIGLLPAAIRLLGDKLAARQVARRAGVPLLPGMTALSRDAAQVAAFAREHGLPVVLKMVFRRRREGHRRGPVSRGDSPGVREDRAGRGRRSGVLCRALSGPRAAPGNPVPGRPARRGCGDFYQGLLAAAASSEDRGGGPGAVPRPWYGHQAPGGVGRESCGRRVTRARRPASSCLAATARSPSSK